MFATLPTLLIVLIIFACLILRAIRLNREHQQSQMEVLSQQLILLSTAIVTQNEKQHEVLTSMQDSLQGMADVTIYPKVLKADPINEHPIPDWMYKEFDDLCNTYTKATGKLYHTPDYLN